MENSEYIFRNATIDDVEFLATAIIESKKIATSDKVGMANLFELSVEELRSYIVQMLEEEIDGCDFSISSFIIAECKGNPVATFGGWIEGVNEDDMPSSLLKSNLIGYVIPLEHVKKAQEKSHLVSDLQVSREPGAYQLEYGYTLPEHRGYGLIGKLIKLHEKRAKESGCNVSKMQVLVYDINTPAIKAYEKSGFRVVQRLEAKDPEVLKYYPHNKEFLLEKSL